MNEKDKAMVQVLERLLKLEREAEYLKKELKKNENTPERISALEKDVRRLEETIKQLTVMSHQITTMESQIGIMFEERGEKKDNQKWLIRTVAGSIILFALGLIYSIIRIGLGV